MDSISPVQKLKHFVVLNANFGFVDDIETACETLTEFETLTTTRFASFYSKDFGKCAEQGSKKHKIYFEDPKIGNTGNKIPFDGCPYIVIGRKVYDCQHGVDRHAKDKKRKKDDKLAKSAADHAYTEKQRKFKQTTKKLDCPAVVVIREILRFPDYKIIENTEKRRKLASIRLRNDLGSGTAKGETRIYMQFPNESDHDKHFLGEVAGISQRIDPRIVNKIHSLVEDGVLGVSEMRRHIRVFVQSGLFSGTSSPPKSNKRFHPSTSTIKNHMYTAVIKQRLAKVDQANLLEKVKVWRCQNEGEFFEFRPYVNPTEKFTENSDTDNDCLEENEDEIRVDDGTRNNGLLFVHQTKCQRRLLNRYGNELCLLDATYRTTKYSLPLYFLVVKTNMEYAVVASFVTQSESTAAIKEALSVVIKWNPNWTPKHFMVDYALEEILSVEELFPECLVLICDFHREQAWGRWLSKTSNGMTHLKAKALTAMRRIARARTVQDYEKQVDLLKVDEEVWSHSSYKKWFEKTWLEQHKRWVWAFRKDRLLVNVNTNNGVERQNLAFKYNYLVGKRSSSLSTMLGILIEEFLPESYNRYLENNARHFSQCRRYNDIVPQFLHDRPPSLIDHCMERLYSASEIEKTCIEVVDEDRGSFKVKSQDIYSHDLWYDLSFGDDKTMPYCQCPDWERNRLPCKHFFAVFGHYNNSGFDKLPVHYRQSPFLTLDQEVIFLKEPLHSVEETAELPTTLVSNFPEPEASEIPKHPKRSRGWGTKCKEGIKQVTSLLYVVDDEDSLKKAHKLIHDCIAILDQAASKEEGLILHKSVTTVTKLKSTPPNSTTTSETCSLRELPKAKRKHPFSGRHGIRAETMKETAMVNVEVTTEPHTISKRAKII